MAFSPRFPGTRLKRSSRITFSIPGWRKNRLCAGCVPLTPRKMISASSDRNGVFAQIPRHSIEKIKQNYFFYTWMEEESIVRWMCSFDTTEDDIRKFRSEWRFRPDSPALD